jgi:hypothetical protein
MAAYERGSDYEENFKDHFKDHLIFKRMKARKKLQLAEQME